jgi:hypothetical protein
MKLPLPSVSIHSPTIAERIDDSSGILIVTDLPKAPFGAIRQLIQHSAKHANRLNKAYPKNLVYKDSFALGNDGPSVDRKHVLDLSPERLDAIENVEPCLFKVACVISKIHCSFGNRSKRLHPVKFFLHWH